MVLESTIICVDNSDFMRNGDFVPTRMQAQQDAVNIVCLSKTRANPENNVALLKMAAVEVLVTLTTDVGRILARLHQVTPKGNISFLNAVRVAHLALKHRQGRNHKLRMVVFVGSPIEEEEGQIVKVAKKLKKEKVNVDVINFGEEGLNTEKLTAFVNALNASGGAGSSHLVTVPPGPMLSDALLSSPVIVGEDGTGAGLNMGSFEFGVDPNEDPELALALRVSMEEQRARQEQEARHASASAMEAKDQTVSEASPEEVLLQRALTMSMGQEDSQHPSAETPLDAMTEEEQIAYALRLSLSQSVGAEASDAPAPMEVDDEGTSVDKPKDAKKEEEDYSEVMNDPAFLQSVLENLPGVDPNSEPIQRAMSSLTKDAGKKEDKDKKEGK